MPNRSSSTALRPANVALALWVALLTIVSGIRPVDHATWFFELFLGFGGIALLLLASRCIALSAFVYWVAAAHYLVLALGAHYTYAEMPLFDWLRDAFGLSRNHFDRVGHFFQGLTPAILVRELLPRTSSIGRGFWTPACAVCAALAFSALYEILEWLWVVVFYPESGPEWLGMQGDPWDAQADMAMALLGALCAVVLLRGVHDRSIRSVTASLR